MSNLIDLRQINKEQLGAFVTGIFGPFAVPFSFTGIQIASGVDYQFLGYGKTYTGIPFVEVTLKNDSNDPLLYYGISGKSTTGCYVQLSNKTTSSNYFIDLYSAM